MASISSSKDTSQRDLVGTVLSGVCAIHCVSMPALMSALPAAAAVLGGFHPLLFVVVVIVAAWALVPGYQSHRAPDVLATAAFGIAVLGFSAFLLPESALETWLSTGGAVLMMVAHLRNRALLRRKSSAATPSAA
jgi:hypothetical protein